MSVQFPDPAPAATVQPGFPVYNPEQDKPAPNPQAPAPDSYVNPLGEYHKLAQKDPDAEKGELMFTIGGVPLYAPRDEDVSPQLSFKMMRDVKKFGPVIAAANMMGELLGEKALDLLADAPPMSNEDWDKILDVIKEKVFSKFQDLPGPGKG